jgi:predicted lipoprotein
LVIGVSVVLYFLPLFHVLPLEAARQQFAAQVFIAAAVVVTFWNDRLLHATKSAVDAGELAAALRTNPADAAQRFGRRLGLGSSSSYFVSGSGRIVAVEGGAITIALQGEDATTVVIEAGPVFGNAIRDGSGLLDVSDFPNSQDFNAISSEINRRVEERVLPVLREKAAVGAAVRFVGGAEIAGPETEVAPLRVVPVVIEFP